jgi:hypothetical protein
MMKTSKTKKARRISLDGLYRKRDRAIERVVAIGKKVGVQRKTLTS